MKLTLNKIVVASLALLIALSAFAGQSVELRMKDGTRWRGEVGQQINMTFRENGVDVPMTGTLLKAEDKFVVIKGLMGGVEKEKLVFKSDIVSLKTVGSETFETPKSTDIKPKPTGPAPEAPTTPETTAPIPSKGQAGKPQGVFVLPLSGMVGEGFRTQEMEAIAKEADKYGPGQIIILEVNSGGGLAIEMERIHYVLKEIKKRHRVVAWIEEAISAAAATAGNCDEIYFKTEGTLGAMTMFAGGTAAQGDELRRWMDTAAKIWETGGRSKYIAWAMIDEKALLSYDKDPVTGEVTWHNDLSGEFDLSDDKQNLTFTSSVAVHCGFADGIADTHEDLAKLLDLQEWHEISDYGRRIAKDWQATVERAKFEIPLLSEQLDYKSTGLLDDQARLGTQIQIFTKILAWWDRAPNVCFLMGVPPKDELERILAEMKKAMADLKKARRNR